MSDNNNNYSNDSIENTRKKKIDEFRRSFDKSVMNDDADYNFDTKYEQSDDDSYFGFSSDSHSLKRHSKQDEINSYSDSDTKRRIERESRKALKQQSKEDKRIEKSKAKRNKKMFKYVWLVMVLLMGIVLSQIMMVGISDMLAMDREENSKEVKVTIPENATMEQIADILEEKGVIERADFFVMYANITSSVENFNSGDYLIDTGKDYEAIINFLQSNGNRTDIVTVQITEGMNILEIADKLKKEKVISDVQEFLDVCKSDDFDETYDFLKAINNKDKRYYKLEGYLFPDTYDFYVNEDPHSVVSKLLNNFENRVCGTKDRYLSSSKSTTVEELINKSGFTMDEIITIASIIQAEAANKEDMYNISSVVHNRLENGVEMGVAQLNCDCTVYYPYREQKDVPASIKDTFKSRYNTFNFNGLPPGPICNPSLNAILAAIGPNDTNYYYFCHSVTDEGSVPYYASTLSEHEYNLSLIEND